MNNANRGYSVQGSVKSDCPDDCVRPTGGGKVRFPISVRSLCAYVEDVLFLLLFLEFTCVCVFYSSTKKISARVRPRSRAECAWRAGAMKTVRAPRETDGPRPSQTRGATVGGVRCERSDFREQDTPHYHSSVCAILKGGSRYREIPRFRSPVSNIVGCARYRGRAPISCPRADIV